MTRSDVVFNLDNRHVVEQMNGRRAIGNMRHHYDAARYALT